MYWSVDKAGNQEQMRHGYVNIAVFYAKAEGLASDQGSEWHNGPWAVTLTAGGTPVSALCFRVDGGNWLLDQMSPRTLDFSTAGNHSVEFYAKNAGGTEHAPDRLRQHRPDQAGDQARHASPDEMGQPRRHRRLRGER